MADIKAAFLTLTVRCCRLRPSTCPPQRWTRWPGCAKTASKRLLLPAARRYICRTCTRGRHPFDGYVTMNGQYCYLADGELLYTKVHPGGIAANAAAVH